MADLIKDIDGGVLEGGGQILRMALAFSVLKQIPVRVVNIRAGRSNPGLRAQHLKGVELVRDISGGKLRGGEIGSEEIVFHPGKVKCGEYLADTGTAGSVGLLIQVALPCILFGNGMTILKLRGGTNAEMAPQIDYITEVFRPLLEKFGGTFDYKIIKRGYFPRGGGEVHIRVQPVKQLKAVNLIESGRVVHIRGWAFVAGSLPIKVAHAMADAASQTLRKALENVDVSIVRYKEDPNEAVGNGSGINLVAEMSTGCILGGSALGGRHLKAEEVGMKAADELFQSIYTGACVDSYSQDQMILLMAIAHGKSRVKCGPVSLHTQTAIHVAHLLTEMVLWATAAAMAVALEPADVQVKDSVNVSTATRDKRTLELFSPLSRSYGSADSRISTGPTASSRVAISTHYFDRGTPPITIRHQTRAPTHHSGTPIRRQRPHTVPAPPYAVQMEPLVQYSQRDPLYHQQQKQALSGKASEQSSFNDLQHVKKTSGTPELQVDYLHKSQHVSSNELSSANTVPPSNEDSLIQTSKNDHELAESNQIPRGSDPSTLLDSEPQAGHLSSEHLYPYDDSSYYLREPEPIIEIIVKESNESLPPSPTQPSPPPRSPTKEPVQVFYVKYKKDPAKYGKDGGIVYDPPVPAVTPASNSDTEEHYPLPSEDSSNQPTPPPLPPQTTTLRTIIRPDSETYHGTGLHVTFGDPHDEDSHDDYQQQSAPHPSVVFPHQNFGPRYQHRPSFVPHDQHKRQQELFQQQPPTPFLHPQPQFHQQQGHLSPHPSSFQRPFNSPPFPQQRQPQFQQPPPLSQQPPFPHQPPQFRHSPPQPPQQQQPQLSNQQPYQKPPFQFQQRPPQPPGPHNQHRYPPQIQQSQQVLLPQRPFQEHLQRPSLQQPQNIQQRPHFAQSPLTLDQRKPVFPLHPGSGFVQQPDQQQNNPQSPVGVQQQQQHLLQQQRQQQLLQLQQQRQHSQQLQQFPVQQQQHLFTQHPQQQSVPVKQQSHLGADIVKSVSQQLHLTPNSQSNQQPLLTSNNKFQHQPSPTQSALFQQPLFSQQTPTRQQPQSVLPTPAINNYSVPPKSISSVPSSTNAPTTVTTPKQHEIKTEVSGDKDKNAVNPSVLASLPDEVPDDLRQQLLSSGILSNADIQILDYDKVGDIPIENLPPEALENFYGAAGAASDPVPSIVSANDSDVPVEMKVVRFNPATAEGQELAEKYVREGATQVDPVVLNDSKYNRYLPLKLSGAQFPLPDVPELRGRNVTSVVVLAPVDYDFQQKQVGPPDDDTDRSSRETKVQVHGVQFVAGEALKELVKEPTFENFKRWLDKENSTVAARQSIVLLVAGSTDGSNTKDIFMYDVGTQKVSSLRGELSSAFVEVAESNANSQELDSLAAASDLMDHWEQSRFELQSGDEPSAAASDIFEDRVLPNQVVDISSSASEQDLRYDETKKDKKSVIPHYLTFAVSESDGESKDDKTSNMILVSSSYSKTSDFTAPSL